MSELAAELAPEDSDARLLQAEAKVRTYCRWHIAPLRTETVTLYPEGSDLLMLPSLRVTNVSLVTEAGVDLDPTAYSWRPNGIIRRIYGPWDFYSQAGVAVTFTHGYEEPPADVTAAVQELAAIGSLGRLKAKTAGPFSETYSTDLNTVDASSLDAYRIPLRP